MEFYHKIKDDSGSNQTQVILEKIDPGGSLGRLKAVSHVLHYPFNVAVKGLEIQKGYHAPHEHAYPLFPAA